MRIRLFAAIALSGLLALTLTAPAPAGDLSIGLLQWHCEPRPVAVAASVPFGPAGYVGGAVYGGGGGCCGGGGLATATFAPVQAQAVYTSAAGCVGSMAYGLSSPGAVVAGPSVSGTFPVALSPVCLSPAGYAPTPAGAEVSVSLARTAVAVGSMNVALAQVGGEAPVMSNAELTAHLRTLTKCVEGLTGTVQRHDAAINTATRATKPE